MCGSSWCSWICEASYSNKLLQLGGAGSACHPNVGTLHSQLGTFWGSSGLTAPHYRAGPVLQPPKSCESWVVGSSWVWAVGDAQSTQGVRRGQGWVTPKPTAAEVPMATGDGEANPTVQGSLGVSALHSLLAGSWGSGSAPPTP